MRYLYLGSGVLLAGLAGSLVYQGPPAKPESAPNKITAPFKSSSKQKAAEGPFSILCRPAAGKDSERPDVCAGLKTEYQALDVVVVFVPDPNLTRLRLQFDRAIEAITWAARDGGKFSFRNLWIPWIVNDPPELTSLEDRQAAEEERAKALKYPGLLVFTGGDQGDRALAVLLVGESPTRAFDATQFDTALRYWKILTDLTVPKRQAQLSQIPIVGPCFSGTFRPLVSALKDNAVDKAFHFLSGSATSWELETEFSRYLSARRPASRYAALTHSELVRGNALSNFLTEDTKAAVRLPFHDLRSLRVATLSEDESAFGVSSLGTLQESSPGRRTFVFPRGISYLRNAYQEDPALASLSSQDFGPTRRTTLQLNLKNREASKDSVQQFADQSAVSEESQMQLIADALHHEQVDIVAVVATDILDSLFVSHFLRLAAPESRLLFFDSDLLASRPDYPPLEGSLVVTPYPLFAARFHWTQRSKAQAFSSQFEEGIYNAATALIQETQGVEISLQDYQPASEGGQPLLWLNVLGRDASWPLAILNDSGAAHDEFLLDKTGPVLALSAEDPLRSWRILYRLGLIGGLSLVLVVWWAQRHSSRWCVDFGLKPSEPGEYSRAFYLLCFTLSLTAIWLTVMSGPIGYSMNLSNYDSSSSWVARAVGAILTGCGVWLSYRVLLGNPSPTRVTVIRRFHYRILALFPWLLFAGYIGFLVQILGRSAHFRSFFYAYRSMEIASGVSPIIPLLFLFLAFSCWSYVHLQRRIFADERFQLLPRITAHTDDIGPIVHRIERSLEAAFPRPFWPAAASALALGMFIVYLSYEQVISLEGRTYDLFFSLALATLVALLYLTLWRYCRTWMVLKSLLEHLELHPIRQAFSALPAEYSWSPVWQHSPRTRTYVLYSRSIDCLLDLLSVSHRPPQPNKDQERLEALVRLLLDRVSRHLRPSAAMSVNLQRAFQETAEQLVRVLSQDAWANGNSETWEKAGRRDALPKSMVLAQEFVALRFVAFIRYVMVQLRNLLTFVIFGYVLLALSLGSYPFGSPQLMAWTLVAIFIMIGGPVVLTFLQMDRDATLRRITDRKAGEGEWGVLRRTAAFGILPLISLLASHFPSIGQYVFPWAQPLLKSIH